MLVTFAFLFALARPASASEPTCRLNAATLVELTQKSTLVVSRVHAEPRQLTIDLDLQGLTSCGKLLGATIELDQYSLRSLDPGTIVGDIALASIDTHDGTSLTIRLTSSEIVIEKLYAHWRKRQTLQPFIKSLVGIEILADYSANAEPVQFNVLKRLASNASCWAPAQSLMMCQEFNEVRYRQLAPCFNDRQSRKDFVESFKTDDPFIEGQNSQISVTSADRNFCYFRSARIPWLLGLSRSLIAANRWPKLPVTDEYTQLSVMSYKVQIIW